MISLEEFMQIFDKLLIEVGDHFDIYYEKESQESSTNHDQTSISVENFYEVFQDTNPFKEKL